MALSFFSPALVLGAQAEPTPQEAMEKTAAVVVAQRTALPLSAAMVGLRVAAEP